MFGTSYKIARVFGIPIRVHITLILTLPLLVFFMDWHWMAALVFVVALFSSIVLHELGHSLVAIRKGARVQEILLLPIGGAARIDHIPTRPFDELLMAAAGPAVSFALFALLFFGGAHLPVWSGLPVTDVGGMRVTGVEVTGVLNLVQLIGILNLALGIFNLLPAFPMDGGRILRAALAGRMGRLKATWVATRLGRLLAVALIGFGLYEWFSEKTFSMLVFVGLFIYWSAGIEYRSVRLQEWRRQHGWGVWGSGSGHEDDGDHVIISPPPYRDGPHESAPIQPVRRTRNPFEDLFGR